MTTYPKRSPLEAIRRFCIDCQSGNLPAVTDCTDNTCPFLLYRHGTALPKGHHAPLRACKRYCHEYCQAGAAPGSDEVHNCQGDKAVLGPCPVFNFRLGKNPNISEETRERLRQSAIKRNPLGLNMGESSQALTPSHAPESTETGRGVL